MFLPEMTWQEVNACDRSTIVVVPFGAMEQHSLHLPLETDALTKIKMFCHEAHSRVLAHGLTSSSAIAFFDSLPDAAAMMPVLEMPAVEQLLDTRKADSHLNRYRQIDRDWAE